jgi:hypothetical protein
LQGFYDRKVLQQESVTSLVPKKKMPIDGIHNLDLIYGSTYLLHLKKYGLLGNVSSARVQIRMMKPLAS